MSMEYFSLMAATRVLSQEQYDVTRETTLGACEI